MNCSTLSGTVSNFFADNSINRAADFRTDENWITSQLQHPDSRFVLVQKSQTLFAGDDSFTPVLLPYTDIVLLLHEDTIVTLLGLYEEKTYFALGLPANRSIAHLPFAADVAFRDLRAVAPQLSRVEGNMLAHARAMMHWHQNHRFCGSCGSPTRSAEAGHVRICRDEACNMQHFPRTDPAIIVLITHNDRALLARQASWPQGQYATIAGFLEPGESLEDAVKREAMEEAGVRLKQVRYHSSQPWPFPGSIMIGFVAEAESDEITVDQKELEDARWFSREEVHAAMNAGTLRLPFKVSISYQLIAQWLYSEQLSGSSHQ